MATIIYAPHYPGIQEPGPKVFLAGSIEMGKAVDWQSYLEHDLRYVNCTLYNPRRKDWDSSWTQDKDCRQFREQVTWELYHLDHADIIALYLVPGTISPISLLEMGLHLKSGNMVICCPKGFERKGNIDITAERYGETVHETWEEFVAALRARIVGHRLYQA